VGARRRARRDPVPAQTDNPAGVDGQVFEGTKRQLSGSYAISNFFDNSTTSIVPGGTHSASEGRCRSASPSPPASPHATYACAIGSLTEVRRPVEDRRADSGGARHRGPILPFSATAEQLPALIMNVKLVKAEGGPHNIA
jgi:hypothetical protein